MPLLFILIPLAGIILLNLFYKNGGRRYAFQAAVVVMLLQIAMSLTMGGYIWSRIGEMLKSSFIMDFRVNSYSALMLFTIGLIAFISLLTGKSSGEGDRFNFYNLILIIVIGMDGVVMVDDVFSLYIFLEITAVASFILIALYKGRESLEGSFKYFVMSTVATVFMLLSIAFILLTAGSLKYDDINAYVSGLGNALPLPVAAAFILFVAGLSVKAGLAPFHGWVPDAYSSAPAPVSVLLAGIVTKIAGVYTLLIVFDSVFAGNRRIGTVLMIFGTVSIVAGAFAAIGQNDFKRMLAYSSISQLGYIILGIGIGTPLALLGAVFHFFNHATFKSLLFVNATAVEMKTGTRQLDKLGGLASKMRITGGSSVIGFLSTAGIPPLSGFWSKVIIIIAAWQAFAYPYAIIAILASVVTLAYFLILQRRVFFGTLAEGLEQVTEAGAGILSAEIILSAIIIAVGLLFPFIYTFINSSGLL